MTQNLMSASLLILIAFIVSIFGIYISQFFLEKNEYRPSFINFFIYFILSWFTFAQVSDNYSIVAPTLLIFGLIICCETDLQIMMIPTVITVVGQILAPFLCYFTSWMLSPLESIVSGVGAWLIMWAIGKIFLKIKNKEGLGLGDADIIALIAAYVGLLSSIRIIFIASLMGVCYVAAAYLTTRKIIAKLPFGPFLSLACLLQISYPQLFKLILGW